MPTSLPSVMVFMGYREVMSPWTPGCSFLGRMPHVLMPPYVCAPGDVDSMISGAKSMVRKANGITSELLDGLNPIQTDLGRIKDSYGSTRSEDFNKALTDANNSGRRHPPGRVF